MISINKCCHKILCVSAIVYTKFFISTALLKFKIKITLFYIICFQLYKNMKNMSFIFHYFLYVSIYTAFFIRLRGAITMHSGVHSGTEHARILFSPRLNETTIMDAVCSRDITQGLHSKLIV